MKQHLIRAGGLALALSAAALAGGPATEAQSTAMVRAVHMAPGAPNVDIAVDGQRAFANLAFKAATDYAPVPAGQRNVKVTPAGAAAPVVIDANLNPQAGQQITVVATGELPNIQPLVLQDDNAAPAAGQAKVRFVHAAPDAPAVDIAVQGGPVLFSNIAFRNVGNYASVPAGTYTLEARPAGTRTAALTVPNVTLAPGQIVTVFAAGKLSDGSLSAVPVVYQASGQGTPGMPRTGAGAATDSAPAWLLALAAAGIAAGLAAPRLVGARRSIRR